MRSFGSKDKKISTDYARKSDEDDQAINIRKGYIPVLVGNEDEEMEKVMIPMKLMKDPCIVTLLEMSAHELGYNQPGTLRIQCQVEHFKRILHTISKRKWEIIYDDWFNMSKRLLIEHVDQLLYILGHRVYYLIYRNLSTYISHICHVYLVQSRSEHSFRTRVGDFDIKDV